MNNLLARLDGTIQAAFCLASVLVLMSFSGCVENPASPKIFVGNPTDVPSPTVTDVSPTTGVLGGVTTLTITGTNFSTDPAKDLVYFDNVLAPVAQATSTQLTLLAPIYVKDNASVQVAVYKAPAYSTPVYLSLGAASVKFGNLAATASPWGVATDAQGNLFASLQSDSIYKFTPAGAKSGYASTQFTKWTALKIGPGGVLYGTRTVKAIYQIPAGGSSATLWASGGGIGTVYDMDFDQFGNIWACGNNASVYRVRVSDKNIKAFPCDANLRTVRVYNGYVYFAGNMNSDAKDRVIRFPIVNADSLGPQEVYFDFPTSPMFATGASIYAITFSSTGEMFVGTDLSDPVLLVQSSGTAQTFYPGILSATLHLFAWGNGSTLYAVNGSASGGVVTASKAIYAINTLKASAPYYGQ